MPTMLPLARWLRRRRRLGEADRQMQSPLFGKLPTELRQMIFRLAVQSELPVELAMRDAPERLLRGFPGYNMPRYKAVSSIRPLNLLLTCRRAHEEALPLLWGANTFNLHSEALPSLARSVGAPWVQRIFLQWQILVQPPGVKAKNRYYRRRQVKLRDWRRVWAALATMRSLRWLDVFVRIHPSWVEAWMDHEADLLAPLCDILRPPARGHLLLEWPRPALPAKAADDMLHLWSVERSLQAYYVDRGICPPSV